MFERFTDRARRVVVLAQEEARILNHSYIGTEHLLLGLIRESNGVASKALTALGIELDAVRQRVEETVGRGSEEPSGSIPFKPRAKKALELSLREALQLGHNYIGTEHILLGLIREGDGVAAQVLVQLGADLNRVREQVIQLLRDYGEIPTAQAVPLPGLSGRERALMSRFRARLTAIDSRLSAVERRVGTGPDVSELNHEIEQVIDDKQAAADAQDYEQAAVLRDREQELLAERASREQSWSVAHPDLSALTQTVRLLGEEVRRLRLLLSQHDIEQHSDEPGEQRDTTA